MLYDRICERLISATAMTSAQIRLARYNSTSHLAHYLASLISSVTSLISLASPIVDLRMYGCRYADTSRGKRRLKARLSHRQGTEEASCLVYSQQHVQSKLMPIDLLPALIMNNALHIVEALMGNKSSPRASTLPHDDMRHYTSA